MTACRRVDPALAAFLSGLFDRESLLGSREAGALFENLVLLHLKAHALLMTPAARIYHWRTEGGKEVDFVIEHGRRLIAVEVKFSQEVNFADASNVRLFMEEYPETAAGLIVYAGDEVAGDLPQSVDRAAPGETLSTMLKS